MSFDFDAAVQAPFRMQPGLRRLAAGSLQLTPAAAGARHQREKLAVLSAFADEALLATPGFDAGPALHALASQAAQEHPQHFSWDGKQARALGVAVQGGQVSNETAGPFGLGDEVGRCLLGLAPAWRLAGLLSLAFEEDFALLDAGTETDAETEIDTQIDAADDGQANGVGLGVGATLPWLAVALPSHWAPSTKVGQTFTAAHAPVADPRLLMQAAGALVRLVTGPERWERFVWTVTPHPRLHAHPARVDPGRWHGHFNPHQAWWRTERQTFIPLPALRQAVFTIGVQVSPLASALNPAQAALVHAAVASMSAEVLAYRGLDTIRQPLLDWLAQPRRGHPGDTSA